MSVCSTSEITFIYSINEYIVKHITESTHYCSTLTSATHYFCSKLVLQYPKHCRKLLLQYPNHCRTLFLQQHSTVTLYKIITIKKTLQNNSTAATLTTSATYICYNPLDQENIYIGPIRFLILFCLV